MTKEQWNRLDELEARIDDKDDLSYEEMDEYAELQELEVEYPVGYRG